MQIADIENARALLELDVVQPLPTAARKAAAQRRRGSAARNRKFKFKMKMCL